MPIALASAPPCGNAASLHLHVPAGATAWRLLRRADADFDAPAGTRTVDAGTWGDYDYLTVLDYVDLVNGVPAWYRMEVQAGDGAPWEPDGEARAVTPAYFCEPLFASPDFAAFVRERLALALKAELLAGHLSHEAGEIPCLTAYPQIDQARLPLVSVILTSRQPAVRGIGEIVIPDQWDGSDWSVFEGWIDRSTLEIGVWSLNHADRVRLRDAVQRAIILNLPVLDAASYWLPDLQASDTQDFESFSAPCYQSVFSLSAQHPALVRALVPPIRTVETTAHAS